MKTFTHWLQERDPVLAEGFVNKWVAPALLGAAGLGAAGMGLMGGGGQQQSAQPARPAQAQVQQSSEVKPLGNNTYEVVGVGQASQIGGPKFANQRAEKDAMVKLAKHLGGGNFTGNVRKEVVNAERTQTGVKVTYRIQILP